MSELTSAQMLGGNPSTGREDRDCYNTPTNVTKALLLFLSLNKGVEIWEPAAGIGKLSGVLEAAGHDVVCSDIHDYGLGHKVENFYKFTESQASIMITNPPYMLAEMFIKKSVELHFDIFCLLLKSTYWHAKTRLDLFEKCGPSHILPLTWRPDFKGLGAPTMDFSWNVWKAKDFAFGEETKYIPLRKPSS